MSTFEIRIETLEYLNDDLIHLVLKRVDQESMSVKAGQFFMIFFDGEDGPDFNRSYSLANSVEGICDSFEFVIALAKGGRSAPRVRRWKPGEVLTASGPHGRFRIRKTDKNIVALATGTGIAPFRSMKSDFIEKAKRGDKIVLIHGARKKNEATYAEEFISLDESQDNFHYRLCLSQEEDEKHTYGRVQVEIQKLELDEDTTYFLCGNPNMVDEVKAYLIEKGIHRRSIRTESYVSPN